MKLNSCDDSMGGNGVDRRVKLSAGSATDITEANFMIGFVRSINSCLDPDRLYRTAARSLFAHLQFSAIVFQPSPQHDPSRPRAFTSVCLQDNRDDFLKLARIFSELSPADIDGHESLGLDFSRPGGLYGSCIYLDLPENMGHVALLWGGAEHPELADGFLTAVSESLASALKNALEFKALKELSMRDSLTGLFNRRVLEGVLLIESERRDPVQHSMVMIDLDDFKLINDTYGHQAGDVVLAEFGDFLRKNCRGSDLAVRYGGEEFAVLVTATAAADAAEFAQRLMRNLQEKVFIAMGHHIRPTVSIGIAHSPGAVKIDLHELLRRADLALYCAKNNGKNQVYIADIISPFPLNLHSQPQTMSH